MKAHEYQDIVERELSAKIADKEPLILEVMREYIRKAGWLTRFHLAPIWIRRSYKYGHFGVCGIEWWSFPVSVNATLLNFSGEEGWSFSADCLSAGTVREAQQVAKEILALLKERLPDLEAKHDVPTRLFQCPICQNTYDREGYAMSCIKLGRPPHKYKVGKVAPNINIVSHSYQLYNYGLRRHHVATYEVATRYGATMCLTEEELDLKLVEKPRSAR